MRGKKEDNILLSYDCYGFDKIGYSKYRFVVTEDYKSRIDLVISQEVKESAISTEEVTLSKNEVELIQSFIEEYLPEHKETTGYSYEEVNSYEGSNITYKKGEDKICLVNNSFYSRRMERIKSFVQESHEELSREMVVSLYHQLSDSMKPKFESLNFSRKQFVKA